MFGKISGRIHAFKELNPLQIKELTTLSHPLRFPPVPDFSQEIPSFFSHIFIFYEQSRIIGYLPILVQEIEVQENNKVVAVFRGEVLLPLKYLKFGLDQFYLFKYCLSIWIKTPFRKLICWSNIKSFNTYKLLLQNVRTVYPSPRRTIPLFMMQLILIIGKSFFLKNFNPTSGTVTIKNLDQNQKLSGANFLANEENTKEVEIRDKEILYFLKLTGYTGIKNSLIVVYPFSLLNFFVVCCKHFLNVFQLRKIIQKPDPVQRTLPNL